MTTPTQTTEEWRAIPGYEGRYEVSDQGRVRSLRLINRVSDSVRATPHIRRPCPNTKGYPCLQLGGRGKKVHRLVLEAFVGPCPVGHEASHLNGDRGDNRLVNLCWESHIENMRRQDEHGTRPRGDGHFTRVNPERCARGEQIGNAKLTAGAVLAIREASARGELVESLRGRFGVGENTIRDVLSGRTWAHVAEVGR